jgi:hypothetical protein
LNKREERIERIVGVEGEFFAARAAVTLLERRVQADPSFGLSEGWRRKDARELRSNLEGTYLIRIFAEFETALRDVWENSFLRITRPPTGALLQAIAARRFVEQGCLDRADAVRVYRNSLVHEGNEQIEAMPIGEARSCLCRYLSRLPRDW